MVTLLSAKNLFPDDRLFDVLICPLSISSMNVVYCNE